ncbi:predicted protein [Naegleria gruberi]|uniref:Predicted protein n=1 Tax=Naegleria gruberi TaxID=5762 RepID=D2V9L8_NAEGR|nr:uncharacterized protein NAEGRDRAFT_65485 [Naegleria gruberi]EFC46610.1 predicted protein [Naegleria gruberi]|eukprot:XP_002679354.1 predicted protein [Naegleria gruberi strain NEG-M]
MLGRSLHKTLKLFRGHTTLQHHQQWATTTTVQKYNHYRFLQHGLSEWRVNNYSSSLRRKKKGVDVFSILKTKYLECSEKDVIEGRKKSVKFSVLNTEDVEEDSPILSEKIRVDKLLSQTVPISREYAQFLLSNGYVKANNKKLNEDNKFIKFTDILKGLQIEIYLENRPFSANLTPMKHVEMYDGPIAPIHVLYEDKDVIVVNKPVGYAVHSSKSKPESETMIYAIRNYVLSKEKEKEKSKKKSKQTTNTLPLNINLAHRMESQMSGVLICGKNSHSIQKLSEQFLPNTNLQKQYITVCAVPNINSLKKKLNPFYHLKEEFDEDEETTDDEEGSNLSEKDILSSFGVSKKPDRFADLNLGEAEELFVDDYGDMEEDGDEELDLLEGMGEEHETLDLSGGWKDMRKEHEMLKEKYEKATKNTTLTLEGDLKFVMHPEYNVQVLQRAGTHELPSTKVLRNIKTVVNVLELNEDNRIALATVSIPSGSVQQVRSHLATNGIPMLGDFPYFDQVDNRIPIGLSKNLNVNKIFFHLYKIVFQHPTSGKNVIVKAPLMSPMKEFVEKQFSESVVDKYINLNSDEE